MRNKKKNQKEFVKQNLINKENEKIKGRKNKIKEDMMTDEFTTNRMLDVFGIIKQLNAFVSWGKVEEHEKKNWWILNNQEGYIENWTTGGVFMGKLIPNTLMCFYNEAENNMYHTWTYTGDPNYFPS